MRTLGKRGDTIVEVVLAISIFSIVAIGAQSLMNKSLSTTMGDFEVSLVRNEIDSQANSLRFLHNAYITAPASTGAAAEWKKVINYVISGKLKSPATFGLIKNKCPTATKTSFIMDTKNSLINTTSNILKQSVTSAKLTYNPPDQLSAAEGIWIEGVRVVSTDNTQSHAGYIDFHIRACWSTVGQELPHTLGTIVRLYDPIQ